MPRVKPLGVNPTEQKIVALLYGAMETEGVQKRDVAAALGMTTATLLRRRKSPLDFTLGELQKACRTLHIPIEDLRSAITL
jgi:DNA-binding Xre family transcriptional regulator